MTKREKAALELEQKILSAIENGEFTPDRGYLSHWINSFAGNLFETLRVEIGPCGCALAAAASVNGIKEISAGPHKLKKYLEETIGLSARDAEALEDGYEFNRRRSTNPYFHVGRRLRRFHPAMEGIVQ